MRGKSTINEWIHVHACTATSQAVTTVVYVIEVRRLLLRIVGGLLRRLITVGVVLASNKTQHNM